jgi:phenylalanyl-tRNA synthetase beta chain
VDGQLAEADVAELKGMIEALHAALGAPVPAYRPAAHTRDPHLHPGRAADLVDGSGHAYGTLGEIDLGVAAAWDLPGRPVAANISLAALFEQVAELVRVGEPPAAQPIDRDLAVLLDEGTAVGELLRLIRSNGGPHLIEARLFDQYRGPQLGAGKVSFAVALRFQPANTGDERLVERAMKRIQGALQHHLGAVIR